MGFLKRRPQLPSTGAEEQANIHPLAKIPIIGELFTVGPLIPKLAEIFQNKDGRMSSKRMGAGAFVVAGIALVNDGAANGNTFQFWGGMGLCAMGVVLFALTRWDGGTGGPTPEQPTLPAS